jgi:predicted amidohydrolase
MPPVDRGVAAAPETSNTRRPPEQHVSAGAGAKERNVSEQGEGGATFVDVKTTGSGHYDKVPLEYDEITVAACQMNPEPVYLESYRTNITNNVNRVIEFCDAANAFPYDKARLLVFPEFTLTGFNEQWTRDDWMKVAIMVPGPETDRIGTKAKELGCYVVFAAHTRSEEWPRHFFNSSVMIGPEGSVIHSHWKAYGLFPGALEYSTTVHDVLDEYVERYGWDAVWPVARTPIGNIATYVCSEGFRPETARAFALNGAEILCRCIGGGGYGVPGEMFMLMFRADCAYSNVYGIYSNGASGATVGGMTPIENGRGGGSMVVDPSGIPLNRSVDSREQIIKSTIPIASFRRKHALPWVRTELYVPAYERHPNRFPPNMYARHLPNTCEEAMKWSLHNARW